MHGLLGALDLGGQVLPSFGLSGTGGVLEFLLERLEALLELARRHLVEVHPLGEGLHLLTVGLELLPVLLQGSVQAFPFLRPLSALGCEVGHGLA